MTRLTNQPMLPSMLFLLCTPSVPSWDVKVICTDSSVHNIIFLSLCVVLVCVDVAVGVDIMFDGSGATVHP